VQKIEKVKKAQRILGLTSSQKRNQILRDMADNLLKFQKKIIKANQKDLKKLKTLDAHSDRLLLNKKRIKEMADQLKEVALLPDVLGKVFERKKRPNGLILAKKTVPLGVIGIIYEARPNVTVDVAGLCFKTGNALVLKGGSEADNSNKAIVDLIKKALKKNGLSSDCVYLIEANKKQLVKEFLKLDKLIDVIIPRGGKGLIEFVRKNSTIPVIETGAGVCHTYVEKTADVIKSARIIFNAKTQRPSVCNALDTLIVDQEIADKLLKAAARLLRQKSILIKADSKSFSVLKKIYPKNLLSRAKETDFGKEFLDLIMSVKVVKDFNEAVAHIQKYSSGHSEAILTNNKKLAKQFLNLIDAAAVYVNTSTRFTDGNLFGLGAEIGISTQKLHARGPMGLKELTSYKWIISSNWRSRR